MTDLYHRDGLVLTAGTRSWDEKKVVEWLHSINCGQYESIFKGILLCDYA